KRLAVEAPGTFNHSWQIGMLSEAAAEAIGANGLLCRVGCYYHDVGKLNKPRYFIENQQDSFNQHKELSPTMSRMIIVGHVKDGMELLEQYRIPRILRQFCETHHGTTLVQYFYHAATQKSSETGEVVEESDFRYPGPKPRTKEAAIVMLADVVEGATRAMKDPTPSRIETLVHNMAMSRLQDGQLSDCDLTIRELSRIEHSLVKSLCAMYHGRISYPGSASSDGDKK
ncbi:MAG: HDIG domain-containing protein, partial [Sedimentisphaerales bacterium]|nr:HDIG domain-containing protein [Sedimentisphaerales bacterium]